MEVLGDNVLVQGEHAEFVNGVFRGITTDDKPEMGKVLKVGPGRYTDQGEFIKTVVEPGWLVLFNEHTTTKFNINGKTYYVLREEDVVGYQHGKTKENRNVQRKVK